MRIDVVSDVVCPWCFIGKRQLEAAYSRVVVVALHPVRLAALADPAEIDLARAWLGVPRRARSRWTWRSSASPASRARCVRTR